MMPPTPATALVSGAIVMGYWVAGLFFLRFWRETRDRLFLIFASAFWILGLQRILLGLTTPLGETRGWLYIVRLVAFVLIFAAIVDKNRGDGGRGGGKAAGATARSGRRPRR